MPNSDNAGPPQARLRKLHIKGFKSFGRAADIALAPLTFLYGPNSGGKSTVLQALRVLRTNAQPRRFEDARRLILRGPELDLGSYQNIAHAHRSSEAIRLGIEFEAVPPDQLPDAPSAPESTHFGEQNRTIHWEFAIVGGNDESERKYGVLRSAHYGVHGDPPFAVALTGIGRTPMFVIHEPEAIQTLTRMHREARERIIERVVSAEDQEHAADFRTEQLAKLDEKIRTYQADWAGGLLVAADGIADDNLFPVHGFLKRDEKEPEEQTRLRDVDQLVRALVEPLCLLNVEAALHLNATRYIGPLREAARRHYVITERVQDYDVGPKGQHLAECLSQLADDGLETVNQWLRRFWLPYRIVIERGSHDIDGDVMRVLLEHSRSRVRSTLADVGFGFSQVLPILVQSMNPAPTVICVEQPELHLHPRLQGHIADLFIDTGSCRSRSAETSSGVHQWIVETHSEAIALRVQRRVREGRLDSRDVLFLYVQLDPDGNAVVEELPLNADGDFLRDWPNAFFERRFRELQSLDESDDGGAFDDAEDGQGPSK